MLERDPALEREAEVFARALIGRPADAYVKQKYAEAHDALPLDPPTAFEASLVDFAALHPVTTRAADAYARLLAPGAALRRKLSVLTAILESSAPFDAGYAPAVHSPPGVLLLLAGQGAAFAGCLALGVLVLTPLRLLRALEGGDA